MSNSIPIHREHSWSTLCHVQIIVLEIGKMWQVVRLFNSTCTSASADRITISKPAGNGVSFLSSVGYLWTIAPFTSGKDPVR